MIARGSTVFWKHLKNKIINNVETTGREVINQVHVLEEKLVTVEKSFKELRVQSHLKKTIL